MNETDLVAGTATAIGSLPHRDPHAAAALVLRCLPDLPAAPQLPELTVRERVVAQWAGAIPDVTVLPDGALQVDARLDPLAELDTAFTHDTHSGLLTFLDVAGRQPKPPRRVKLQTAGPLTMGVALMHAGVTADVAFPLALRVVRSWSRALDALVAEALPGAETVLFLDEPGLVRWRNEDAPLDRELAIDALSSALVVTEGLSGVHVCGRGDLRLVLDAGPDIVHFDLAMLEPEHSVAIARFLEGGGWIAWGAVPTHRPVGERPQPLWNTLLDTWCDLTRRGCDPVRLRTQALIAPACGLAGHGLSQAERAMLLAREIGDRVHDHAAATKLTVGA